MIIFNVSAQYSCIRTGTYNRPSPILKRPSTDLTDTRLDLTATDALRYTEKCAAALRERFSKETATMTIKQVQPVPEDHALPFQESLTQYCQSGLWDDYGAMEGFINASEEVREELINLTARLCNLFREDQSYWLQRGWPDVLKHSSFSEQGNIEISNGESCFTISCIGNEAGWEFYIATFQSCNGSILHSAWVAPFTERAATSGGWPTDAYWGQKEIA